VSSLVPEIGWIVDRILVVAPNESSLKNLFEELSFELTENFGAGQKLDLASASMPTGPIRCWTSFSAGRRANATARFSLIGVTVADLATHPNLMEVTEAIFVSIDAPWNEVQRWLSMKSPVEGALKPLVVAGAAPTIQGADPLEVEALREWFRRHFKQVRFLEKSQDLLTTGLEWALSF